MTTTENSEPLDRVSSEMDAKRQAILRQAIDVFADEGFRHTDVQVIADRAGVGKGTVYRYFGNKEDLFWATTFAVFEELRQHIMQAMEGLDGTLPKLEAACLAYADYFEANPKSLEVFVQERAMFRGACPETHREHHDELLKHFADLIAEGAAAGEVRPVDPLSTVNAVGGSLYGVVVHSCYTTDQRSLTERVRHMVRLLFDGIRPIATGPSQGN